MHVPDFPIVDAHVHLYDPRAIAYPWMASVPLLDRPHGLAEFTAASAGVDVESVVFVEVDCAEGLHLDEARWVERHGEGDGRLKGIVCSLPVETGAAVEADLARFAALKQARGVRRLIQDRPPGWAIQSAFVEGVQALAAFDLSFDICIRHGQIGEALQLARACPRVRFVLDHIGKPSIATGLREPWRALIRELGREPNVWCKISGIVTEADHDAWSVADLAPSVIHAIECFGFARCMFGGDWPVSRLAASYRGWVEALDRILAGASELELRQVYRETATSFYGL